MLSHFRLLSLTLCALCVTAQASTYEKDVLPILKKNCFKCHNNDKMKAGVSVEVKDMKSDVGRIIIPGDPRESMLYESIVRDDDRMPPKGELSSKEIAAIRDWIKDGAKFDGDAGAGGVSKSGLSGLARKPLRGKWTNKEGRVIEADLLRVVEDRAVLRLANGKIYNYPIADLADESATKVREFGSK